MNAGELQVRVARKHDEALDICTFELVRVDGQPLPVQVVARLDQPAEMDAVGRPGAEDEDVADAALDHDAELLVHVVMLGERGARRDRGG